MRLGDDEGGFEDGGDGGVSDGDVMAANVS